MKPWWIVTAVSLLIARSSAPVIAQSAIVDADVWLPASANECRAVLVAERLFELTRTAGGIELMDGPCRRLAAAAVQPERGVNLRGLTLAAALNRIVAVAPSYRWRDIDGVIVMRPARLWDNGSSPLEREARDVTLRNATMPAALDEVRTLIGLRDVRGNAPVLAETDETRRPISVNLHSATPLMALNAIAGSHAALIWKVAYCRERAAPQFAEVSLRTFDGHGIGGRPIDPAGQADGCDASR